MLKSPWWWLFLAGAAWFAARLFANIEVPARGSAANIGVAVMLKTFGNGIALLLCGLSLLASVVAGLRQFRSREADYSDGDRYEPSWDGSGPLVSETAPAAPEWTLELLRDLEWKRVERLAALYFQCLGFRAEETDFGPDGGVDLRLCVGDAATAGILVQCKAWNTWRVGVKEIRELFGVMAAEGVAEGIFLTTSTFTPDAIAFAKDKNVTLIDGEDFVRKLRDLPAEQQADLLIKITRGDYRRPICPSCGERMKLRHGRTGEPFWGCITFPACRATMPLPGARRWSASSRDELLE